MSEKVLNSIKIALSIVGAIIGAGFITGREIIRFFYGGNCFLLVLVLNLFIFLLVFLLLSNHSKKVEKVIFFTNRVVCIFNIIIIASMLGATDSLFNGVFDMDERFPFFSLCLLTASTLICLKGIDWINRANLVLVPIMAVLLCILLIGLPAAGDFNQSKEVSFVRILLYASMNCLLTQPFILKLKEGKIKFSPLISAIFVSVILSLFVILYLRVLTSECAVCDIPILCLLSAPPIKYFTAIAIIFFAIASTQIGAQYPLIKNYVTKKQCGAIKIALINLIAFFISRIGFYKIVDLLYPIIAIFACTYFVIISILAIIFPKAKRKDT